MYTNNTMSNEKIFSKMKKKKTFNYLGLRASVFVDIRMCACAVKRAKTKDRAASNNKK